MKLIELAILGAFDMIFYIMISGKIANHQYEEKKKSYIIPAILLSTLIGIVGVSSLRKYNTLISVILQMAFAALLYRRKIKETIYICLTSMIIIMLIQYLVLLILKFIKVDIVYEFSTGLMAQGMALVIVIGVNRYLPTDTLLNYINKNNRVFKYLTLNIFIILASVMFYWYIDMEGILSNIIGIGVLTVGIIYINFILMENGLKNELEEEQLRIYETYLPIIGELIDELRIKQHEYDNHIQALNMLATTNLDYEKMDSPTEDYINHLGKSNTLGDLIKLDNKVLVGLLYSKFKNAEKLGIEFKIIIEDYEFKVELEDYEVVEVIGNLINNGLETGVEDNSLVVRLSQKEGKSIIEVSNKHPYLKRQDVDKIFNKGFSTKSQAGRGYGLYNIEKIVKSYGGEIQVLNKGDDGENYIVFKVLFIRN